MADILTRSSDVRSLAQRFKEHIVPVAAAERQSTRPHGPSWTRITASAKAVVDRARTEAFELRPLNVEPEHILLGLLGEPEESVAARVLSSLNLRIEHVRAQVVQLTRTRPVNDFPSFRTPSSAPFTPHAMQILESASLEAIELGHDRVDPEHILLGLAGEPDGVASRILEDHDVNSKRVRREVIRLSGLNGSPG